MPMATQHKASRSYNYNYNYSNCHIKCMYDILD